MNFTYLLLFNLYLACWLGLYGIFFSRNTFFKINRFILLAGILIAAIIPLIHLHWPIYPEAIQPGKLAVAGISPQMISRKFVSPSSSPFAFWNLIIIVYWLGVATMTFLLARKFGTIHKFIKRHPHKLHADHIHIITRGLYEVFSFGNYLFAPEKIENEIYQHELIHIRQKHTLDNLLLEVVKIFCWFNPFSYLYQQALRTVHEFLADAKTTKGPNKYNYAHLLVSQTLNHTTISLINSFFNRSLLQKRLIMLQKKRSSRKAGWKYLLVVPFMAGLLIVSSAFSIKNKVEDKIAELNAVSKQPVTIKGVVTNQASDPISSVNVLQVGTVHGTVTDAKGHFTIKNFPANGLLQFSMIGYTTITVQAPVKKPLHVTLYKEPTRMNKLVVVGYSKEKLSPKPKAKTKNSESEIFMFVEQMPSFPGGKEALIKYLHDHIRYPQAARKQHLQGNVIVSFVVGKDGNISEVHTISPRIGGGLEQEAMRIVEAMPKWRPGKQNDEKADVLYTLPIQFSLQ